MIMKTCSKCKIEKLEMEFNKRPKTSDGLNYQCKTCTREAIRNCYYKRADYYKQKALKCKQKIADFVKHIKETTPCKDCGNSYEFYLMDFDHLNEKKFNMGHARNKGFDQVKKEIEKCEVLCCFCHRKRTYFRQCTRGDNGMTLRFERRE